MRHRQLGGSGLLVSEMCLGTMIFGEESARGVPEQQARAIIDLFLEAGGDFLDTADVYAQGASERIVGEAVTGIREKVVISTKVGLPTGPGANEAGLGRKHIVAALEASLKRLSSDYVDILMLHTHDPITPIRESLEAAQFLIDAGKVRYIGVCNQFAWRLSEAMMLAECAAFPRIVCAQYQYSPVCRWIEDEYFGLFERFGISLIPWSPLGGGTLSGKYQDGGSRGRLDVAPNLEDNRERRLTDKNRAILEVLGAIAAKHGVAIPQVALAWSLLKSPVGSIAIGARTEDQLAINLGAGDVCLDNAEIGEIDRASAVVARYPYDFMSKERPGARSAFAIAAGTQ